MSASSTSGGEKPPAPHKGTRKPGLVGVIYASTETIRFTTYQVPEFKEVETASEEIELKMPREGWFEVDPEDLMSAIYQCCAEVCAMLPARGYKTQDMFCVAVTNQRETTVLWDATTGQPLYNAILWNDIRTTEIADNFISNLPGGDQNYFKTLCGLPVSTYFSALKICWLQQNVPAVRKAIRAGNCKAGTLDSWIVWNLTKGQLHITDVTNASRTLLMNIKTLNWDPVLLKAFGIDKNILPQIRSSSETYGRITASRSVLKEVLICGIIGDRQASLVGQLCLARGSANCSYGFGCFLICNTGIQRIVSPRGLVTTVAYKMGPNASPMYALEGSVAVGGHALEWLTTKVRILPDISQAENYAKAAGSTEGLYFVPAFTGLYAPYWRKDARGIIIGLDLKHTARDIVRAAFEAVCFQITDILDCILKEHGITLTTLHADGKLSENRSLMQWQADIAGIEVAYTTRQDRTTLGAAICAAHAYSIDLSAITKTKPNVTHVHLSPTTNKEERELRLQRWHRAVKCSMGWTTTKKARKSRLWLYLLFAIFIAIVAVVAFYVMRLYRSHTTEVPCPPIMNRRRKRNMQAQCAHRLH